MSFLRKTMLQKVSIVLCAAGLFFVSIQMAMAAVRPDDVIQLVNAARKQAGIAALKKNSLLTIAAQKKINDMFKNNYFDHNSPQGKTPYDWILESGYNYQFAGENLAINYDTAKEQQDAWMRSQEHRENILNPQYSETGVAVKRGTLNGEPAQVTVEMFGFPMSKAQTNITKNETQKADTNVSDTQTLPAEPAVFRLNNQAPLASFADFLQYLKNIILSDVFVQWIVAVFVAAIVILIIGRIIRSMRR